jgi:hypothetical protein
MKSSMLKWNLLLISAAFLALLTAGVQAQNLVVGGDMTNEADWNLYYYGGATEPTYEFNYTTDTLKFGHGGNLHILQGEAAGQLLIWQTVTLIAGKTYRASAAIRCLNYQPGPAGGGAWYQLYLNPEMPDPDAADYNPGAKKLFNMDGWQADFPVEFDGMWESISLGGGEPWAPYYTPEGTPGEEVEVTFGVKFGQYWGDYTGTAFELVVDDLGLYPVESSINTGGSMEDESAWDVAYFGGATEPVYEFNYTTDTLKFGHGGNLHILQGEAAGQLLLYQTLTLAAGETYRATAAIRCLNYQPGPAGGGAWYQMYVNPELVDPNASDYNPGAKKLFNMDGWQADFPVEFNDLWETVSLGGGEPWAPYFTAPGNPGETVDVTFGIKFGQYWGDYTGTAFELVVDDVYLLPLTEAGKTAVEDKGGKARPEQYSLAQNYPNPFNPSTKIDYAVAGNGQVRLTVFDLKGREIATLVDGIKPAGRHSVTLDAGNLKSGVYFYKLQADGATITRKMLLVK